MDKLEFQELLEDICEDLTCDICMNIKKECINEYIKQLLATNIDFSIMPIGWLLYFTLDLTKFDTIFSPDISLLDAFIDKEKFEEYMEDSFGVVNPIIYEYARQAASQVKNKLVTYESRHSFYSSKISEFENKLQNSINNREREDAQFSIDYYTELLEKISSTKNSKKR